MNACRPRTSTRLIEQLLDEQVARRPAGGRVGDARRRRARRTAPRWPRGCAGVWHRHTRSAVRTVNRPWGRIDEQRGDEHEHEGVGHPLPHALGQVPAQHDLGDAERETADDRAGEAAEPADDRRHDGLDEVVGPERRLGARAAHEDQHGGHAGEQPGEGERAGDHPVRPHTHQPGGVEVLARRPHGDPEQRATEHVRRGDEHDAGDADRHEVHHLEADAGDLDRVEHPSRTGERLLASATRRRPTRRATAARGRTT